MFSRGACQTCDSCKRAVFSRPARSDENECASFVGIESRGHGPWTRRQGTVGPVATILLRPLDESEKTPVWHRRGPTNDNKMR